jgi:hypothetical protein
LAINGKLYAVLSDPIFDSAGRPVGLIRVLEEVTDQVKFLRQVARFNIAVCAVVWLVTIFLLTWYFRRIHRRQISCAQVLSLEENDRLEFKSSFRWDYKDGKFNREMELQVVKAVAGFMNSEGGGTVAIGISDEKEVLGLEADYSTLKTRKNRDGFEQSLRQALVSKVGEHRCARCVKVNFCSANGKDICLISVSPAREPTYLEEAGGQTMYVRVGNATRPLNVKEAVAYAGQRWVSPTLQWSRRRSTSSVGI